MEICEAFHHKLSRIHHKIFPLKMIKTIYLPANTCCTSPKKKN